MIKEIDTFKDLFIFLQNYEGTNIIDYLNKGKKQEKGYKQEALLRLFTSLGLIDKINNKYNFTDYEPYYTFISCFCVNLFIHCSLL